MLDLLLIQQSAGSWEKAISNFSLPLSLISAAREIPEEYNIKLIDARITGLRSLEPYIHQEGLLIGFSVLTGHSIKNALEIIRYIRGINPTVKILMGGIHPSILGGQTLSHPLVDYIITGPGEIPIKELLQCLRSKDTEKLRKIPGLGLKDKTGLHITQAVFHPAEEINSYRLPAYHLIDIKNYLFDYNGLPTIYLETSRGCNHNCAFCSNVPLKNRWVPMSAEYSVNNIEFLYNRYSIKSFLLIDLDFFFDLERVRRFCRLLLEKGLKVSWHNQGVRVAEMFDMDDEFVQLLKESGFREFEAIGTESGSQRIVDLMGKQYKIEKAVSLNRKFARHKIPMRYNFMIGSPAETYDDVKETVKVALKLNSDNSFSSNSMFYIYAPYPGTRFYEQAVDMGFNPPDSLEGWSNLPGWFTAPIHGKTMRKKLERIHFLSIFTTMTYWKKFFRRFYMLKFMFSVYNKIAIFRLKHDFLLFMPELYLWRMIRKD